MAELFKNIYNQQFFEQFTNIMVAIKPEFNKKSFIRTIYDDVWEERELKQRMRHITLVLKNHLSDNYKENIVVLLAIITYIKKNNIKEESIEYMFLPDFIEVFGLDDYDTSIHAIEQVTQFTSCEFTVRPFIIRYKDKMIAQMKRWSGHDNAAVRRLATEGARPRLPWAMALPSLKKDPSPILPILESLKNDPSEYVRRSVANNLNDISKDNSAIVIELVKKWIGKTKATDWVVKHGCRTLLKEGNTTVLGLFGFGSVAKIVVNNFKIHTPKVRIDNSLEFSFSLENTANESAKIRLEYGLYYQKANGTLSRKVFKISEKTYSENSVVLINRKQSFKIITTRKFYTGLHQLSIIINGVTFDKLDFQLID